MLGPPQPIMRPEYGHEFLCQAGVQYQYGQKARLVEPYLAQHQSVFASKILIFIDSGACSDYASVGRIDKLDRGHSG